MIEVGSTVTINYEKYLKFYSDQIWFTKSSLKNLQDWYKNYYKKFISNLIVVCILDNSLVLTIGSIKNDTNNVYLQFPIEVLDIVYPKNFINLEYIFSK